MVTVNLQLALRHLRLPSTERVLWVDAVCINQNDILEKNHEVAHMRQIYLGAQQVIVWLGKEDDAKAALNFCSKLELRDDNLGIIASSDEDWQRCGKLFTRPWWTRAWILQEVIHDRPVTVHIGTLQVALDDLCKKYHTYQVQRTLKELLGKRPNSLEIEDTIYKKHFRAVATVGNTINQIGSLRKKIKNEGVGRMTLENALVISRAQDCRDPKDKVYAFLGMVDDANIPIDYTSPTDELYTNTMKQLLRESRKNALLLVSSHERPISGKALPSWVSDWTTSLSLVARTMYSVASGFDAPRSSNMKPAHSLVSFDDNTLVLQGRPIGVVTRTSFSDVVFGLGELENEYHDKLKLFKYEQHPSLKQPGDQILPDDTLDTADPPMTMKNSSWGSYWAETGDIIIVSQACTIPLIIRKHGDAYLFVGGCWLVDSELRKGQRDAKATEDPGFSTIMRGSAWDKNKLEEFRIV
jgi:hypothetical protein